jgi:hypothetical protein
MNNVNNMNIKADWDAFKDGWASGSMECPTCGRIFRDVRFRFCCHDKVEGDWPMCCGVVARYCYDWKPEKKPNMDQQQLDDQASEPKPDRDRSVVVKLAASPDGLRRIADMLEAGGEGHTVRINWYTAQIEFIHCTDHTHTPSYEETMTQPNTAPTEKLPQRFAWRDDGEWHFGVCIPMVAVNVEYWQIIAGKGQGSFDSNPWESMGHVIGDGEFRWIDNDFNWEPREPPQENPPTAHPVRSGRCRRRWCHVPLGLDRTVRVTRRVRMDRDRPDKSDTQATSADSFPPWER